MRKLERGYQYMACSKCWMGVFDNLHSAKVWAENIDAKDMSIWAIDGNDAIVGLYGRDFDGEEEPVLNDKELLEKCKTNQPITDEDIGRAKDYINSTKSCGVAIAQNATAGIVDVSGKKDIKVIPEYKPHICTEEELRKMKMLQACKERDLATIQAHLRLGYDNDSLCRMLRNRIKEYDKYMYAIKTGDTDGINLELVTPMEIVEKKEKMKEPVKSNKKETAPYSSLLDDEKAERINKCLNKL